MRLIKLAASGVALTLAVLALPAAASSTVATAPIITNHDVVQPTPGGGLTESFCITNPSSTDTMNLNLISIITQVPGNATFPGGVGSFTQGPGVEQCYAADYGELTPGQTHKFLFRVRAYATYPGGKGLSSDTIVRTFTFSPSCACAARHMATSVFRAK